MYYKNKTKTLSEIFGTPDIQLQGTFINVAGKVYPIVDDVIILLKSHQIPCRISEKIQCLTRYEEIAPSIEKDIQYTFGEEWKTFNKILPQHHDEFKLYFDLIDLPTLESKRICDLGCGIGRWSYFLKDIAKEIVLIDFSESIFEARKNLSESDNTIFIMADVLDLPFPNDTFDFIFCLGVLHHIPQPALQSVRKLSSLAPEFLIYLYYALDNRGALYKLIFYFANMIRNLTCNITSPTARSILTEVLMWLLYIPIIIIGKILTIFGAQASKVPFNFYGHMNLGRIRQDVYDRFFTRIEQRVSKQEIQKLSDTFSEIVVSDDLPFWHFLCRK
jgi:SAM-dependent methyltransferase